jgi:stage III sporulation protein AG
MITSGSSEAVVIKTNEAKIKGVIVVASGASDPQVKETLYSAVQTALQISGHQVEIYTK